MTKPKRYKQKYYGWIEEDCKAIKYTGDNIREILIAFPTCAITMTDIDKFTCTDTPDGGIYVSSAGTNGSDVHGCSLACIGDYIIQGKRRDNGKEVYASPLNMESFVEYDDEEVAITKETDDEIYTFATQYEIDYRLCRTVFSKCRQYYEPDNKGRGVMLELLVKAFNDYDICIDSDTFVKFNFLLDKWVEKYGTEKFFPIASFCESFYGAKDKSKLPLLNDMRIFSVNTLKEYFKKWVLIKENAIDYMLDFTINKYCKQNGIYLTDFGVVEFKGEI